MITSPTTVEHRVLTIRSAPPGNRYICLRADLPKEEKIVNVIIRSKKMFLCHQGIKLTTISSLSITFVIVLKTIFIH